MSSGYGIDWYLAVLESGKPLATSAEVVDFARKAKQRLHEDGVPLPSDIDSLVDGRLPTLDLRPQDIRYSEPLSLDLLAGEADAEQEGCLKDGSAGRPAGIPDVRVGLTGGGGVALVSPN
jgi:hypothetical protein